MTELKRITTEYMRDEDRLRLTGVSADDATPVAIWLTARLSRRLVPPLVQWLEQQGGASPHAQALQSFVQHTAKAGITPQAPVKARADSATWLAHSIDLTRGEEGVRLTFKGLESQSAVLNFGPQPLRQWLAIVLEGYRQAEWPLDAWPAWMTENPLPAGQAGVLLH